MGSAGCHFHHGDYGETLNVGNNDEGDAEEVMLTWAPCVFDPSDVMGLELACLVGADPDPKATGGDPLTIWLDPEAIEDRSRVRSVIAWGRCRNGLPGVEVEDQRTGERWRALGVEKVEPPDAADCFTFGRWWEEERGGWPRGKRRDEESGSAADAGTCTRLGQAAPEYDETFPESEPIPQRS